MAQKTYQPKGSKKTGDAKPRDEWTQTMLDRASDALSADLDKRRDVIEDMKFAFVSGHQWDPHLTSKRRNKPNYEFNRVRQLIRRVTGQQLKNKPNIKVRAVEDNDVDTADVYNGLIKNIEVQSSAETAYDTAFQWACGGGFGDLRVRSKYEHDMSFDQCLLIEAIDDPASCSWPDPSSKKFDKSDARYWFIVDTMPIKEFKRRWTDAEPINFEVTYGEVGKGAIACGEDEVIYAEYWYLEPKKKTIYLLSDGSVVDAEEFDPVKDDFANPPVDPATGQPAFAPVTIKQTRETDTNEVYSCLVSGHGKLEEPVKWGGTMIPIVRQWGDYLAIEGKQEYSGMTRFARDAQMIHNFETSTMVEVVAKLPNSPLTATAKMIEGLESYYERMGYDDPPVLPYNIDPAAPGARPQREPMPQLPSALANLSALATDEMKAVTGVYDASIGAQSNEQSGRAIMARQNQGDIANFVYIDNQVKALKRLGEILVDAIPHYYDADRSIRILGEDLGEKYIKINHAVQRPDGTWEIENDLSRGKFDVTVTVGKSYDTARMELADTAQAIAQTPGPIGALGQFLLLKSLDVPGIDEYLGGIRKILVQQGILEPKEGDQPPTPPQPNPKDVADAKHRQAQAALAQAKAQEIAAKLPAQVQQIEADTAETVAKIPGHEAAGHQTMIQNAQATFPMAPPKGPEQPIPDVSDQYQKQF